MEEKYYLDIQGYKDGIYHGYFNQDNKRTGIGVFLYKNGSFFFGEWKYDVIDGEGIIYFQDGGFMHGFFSQGQIQGVLFVKYGNGDIVECRVNQKGQFDGTVYKYYCEQNIWFKFQFEDGKFLGILDKGEGVPQESFVFDYISSPKQISQRFNKQIQQHLDQLVGVTQFKDGGQYIGVVNNQYPDGLGIFRYNDGLYDAGIYEQGSLNGYGIANKHNKDRYEGQFIQGMQHGNGFKSNFQQNSWVFGKFLQDQCVDIQVQGKGEIPQEQLMDFRGSFYQSLQKYLNIQQIDMFNGVQESLQSLDKVLYQSGRKNYQNVDSGSGCKSNLKNKIYFTLGKGDNSDNKGKTNFIQKKQLQDLQDQDDDNGQIRNLYDMFERINRSEKKGKKNNHNYFSNNRKNNQNLNDKYQQQYDRYNNLKNRHCSAHSSNVKDRSSSKKKQYGGNKKQQENSNCNQYVYPQVLRMSSSSKKKDRSKDNDQFSSILYCKIDQAINDQMKLKQQQKYQKRQVDFRLDKEKLNDKQEQYNSRSKYNSNGSSSYKKQQQQLDNQFNSSNEKNREYFNNDSIQDYQEVEEEGLKHGSSHKKRGQNNQEQVQQNSNSKYNSVSQQQDQNNMQKYESPLKKSIKIQQSKRQSPIEKLERQQKQWMQYAQEIKDKSDGMRKKREEVDSQIEMNNRKIMESLQKKQAGNKTSNTKNSSNSKNNKNLDNTNNQENQYYLYKTKNDKIQLVKNSSSKQYIRHIKQQQPQQQIQQQYYNSSSNQSSQGQIRVLSPQISLKSFQVNNLDNSVSPARSGGGRVVEIRTPVKITRNVSIDKVFKFSNSNNA